MTEQAQNGQQQTQEDQYLQEAQSFYGQSIGRVKSQVQNYRQQLEQFSQQFPEGGAQAQVQEMLDSYSEIEGTIDRAAQDTGVEDAMSQAVEKTQQQMQEVAQGAAQQAQDTAGQVTGQAQEAAGQATDQVGQVAGQAQDAAGGATQQVQDAVGGVTGGGQQGGGPLGGVTDQVGQVAGQAQQAAGQAAQQATGGGGQQQPDATHAAQQKAQELGVDLSQVQGSGAGGRVTIRDVIGATNQ
jgi:pyruvate/2-oxoglutarate dehydrogenase complex dihydrolipoamide acyltransferase (E2) component